MANKLPPGPPRQLSNGSPFAHKSPKRIPVPPIIKNVSPSTLFLTNSHKTWTPSSPIQHYFPYVPSLRSVQLPAALIRQPLLSTSHRRSTSPASSTPKRNKWVDNIAVLLLQLPSFQLLPVLLFRKSTRPSFRILF